jgi:hypothetical protein
MAGKGRFSKLIGGAIAGAGLVAGYALAIRPRILTWGATDEEVKRQLPGDDLVRDARMESTHAVTIDAPPGEIWPWLVQIGHQRAGWYSYDWLHRLMGVAGSVKDEHGSAMSIIPELQDLQVGDVVEIGPDMGYSVVEIEADRALVLHTAIEMGSFRTYDPSEETPAEYFTSSWTWFLEKSGKSTTRLLVRIRIGYSASLANALMVHGLLEPGSFVMERRTLLGIKQRVEASRATTQPG